jgi:citrate synthase
MIETAKIVLADKTEIELPVIEGTEAEKAIDISSLRAKTGYITFDNGYGNTGSCVSDITFLDGEKGILKHRGYTIEELCEKSNFLEVSKLLLDGKLPSQTALDSFKQDIAKNLNLPQGIIDLIKTFPKNAHPMGILSAAIVALSGHYQDLIDQDLSAEQ